MPHRFKSFRRITRLRASVLAVLALTLVGCDGSEAFNADGSAHPEATDPLAGSDPIASLNDEEVLDLEEEDGLVATPVAGPDLAVSFAGGIPIGTFALPTSQFGSLYNGAHRTIGPYALRRELAAIKSRGGKIVLMMAGSQRYYKDAAGRFSLTKWKQRVNRYRGINFSSYIKDGTIIAHYLIDEPYDAGNWNGRPVSGATVEAMAKYSKQLWPTLPTVVRAEPYLIKWSGTYRYLDAAWAQYLWRKGNVHDYLKRNVSEARRMGLGLIVGLNLRHGGNPKLTPMSASEVKSWGSALLSSSYPCAFISWQYRSELLSTTAMKSAMRELRRKAENRSPKSCRT